MSDKLRFGFGRMLREWRLRKGLKQKDAAHELGIGQDYLSVFEREARVPPPHIAKLLVGYYRPDAEAAEGFYAAIDRAAVGDQADRRREIQAARFKDLPLLPRLVAAPVGRDDTIRDILGYLTTPGGIVNIVGEPGIGKTTIATAVAQQLSEQNRVVIWGDAREGEAKTASEIEALVWKALIGREPLRTYGERAHRVLTALGKYQAVLIIDNMESAADFDGVVSYLSSVASAATILSTSRLHIPEKLGRNVLIQELGVEDGILLFGRVAKRAIETQERMSSA